MNQQEKIVVGELQKVKEAGDIVTNREVFYIMQIHENNSFETQDKCDDVLAKLIFENKIDKKLIFEDDYFKFNKNLEKIIKN